MNKVELIAIFNLLKIRMRVDIFGTEKLLLALCIYGSARKSYLMMLYTVLGAFRTAPVESLYVEAEEPSLYLRREKLALQYAIRLAPIESYFQGNFSTTYFTRHHRSL